MPAHHLTATPGTEPTERDHAPHAGRVAPTDPAVTDLEQTVLTELTRGSARTAARLEYLPIADPARAAEIYRAAGRSALAAYLNSAGFLQVSIEFSDSDTAEMAIATLLAPHLRRAETSGTVTSWWFVRKSPRWHVRIRPGHGQDGHLHRVVADLVATLGIHDQVVSTEVIYEPEMVVFGGPEAMDTAHRFFHHDSSNVLAYLERTCYRPGSQDATLGRREVSMLLCTALLRGAGQDWHEQGDVWHRVAQMRPLEPHIRLDDLHGTAVTVRRLQELDTHATQHPDRTQDALEDLRRWIEDTRRTGETLRSLARHGALHRGLRDVLAHHVIFAWNRMGLNDATQAVLAHSATIAILDTLTTTTARAAPDHKVNPPRRHDDDVA